MRIAVSRFDDFLLLRQFRSKIYVIVPVLSPFRKQCPKSVEELRHQIVTVVHAQREASVQISGCRVERAEERTAVTSQQIAALADARGDIDGFEPSLWR